MNDIDILIASDDKGGAMRLTNQTESSRDGSLVLSIKDEEVSGDFGPTDMIDFSSVGGGLLPAEDIISGWLQTGVRQPEELEAGRLFLHQRS